MDRKPVPFRATVFVCTNVREGKAACGNAGQCGLALHAALKEEVAKRGLKGAVRVVRSGCLDRCAEGPNVFVYPTGDWYSGAGPADVPGILQKLP